jgi:RND family efflux transporter MFP subunit
MKTWIWIIIALALAGTGAWFGLPYLKALQKPEDPLLSQPLTATVERRDIETVVEVAGDINPLVQVEVKAEVSAKIKKLLVEPGQVVKVGQTLVELDDSDLLTERASSEIEISQTRVELEKAKRDLDRNKRLFEKNLVSEQTYLDADTAFKIASAQQQQAEKRLQIVQDKIAKTKVNAPIAGTALDVPTVEGQVVVAAASVNSGTMLVKLADMSKLLIATHVNQVDIAKLKEGMAVNFTVDSIGTQVMSGKIYRISPLAAVKNNVKGFTVEILIENPDPGLKPGMTANVIVPIDKAPGVLAVPLAAVFSEPGGGKVAYVEKGSGDAKSVEKRDITIGASNIDFVEVKQGVSENETVLLVKPRPGA